MDKQFLGYIYALLIIITGCNNSTEISTITKDTIKTDNQLDLIKNHMLLDSINVFINQYSESNERLYVLNFSKIRKDTTVFISSIPCFSGEYQIKGIGFINKAPLAIVDNENIGSLNYDSLLLNDTIIKNYKCKSPRPYAFNACLYKIVNKDSIEFIRRIGGK